jgi:hypothetical protein
MLLLLLLFFFFFLFFFFLFGIRTVRVWDGSLRMSTWSYFQRDTLSNENYIHAIMKYPLLLRPSVLVYAILISHVCCASSFVLVVGDRLAGLNIGTNVDQSDVVANGQLNQAWNGTDHIPSMNIGKFVPWLHLYFKLKDSGPGSPQTGMCTTQHSGCG